MRSLRRKEVAEPDEGEVVIPVIVDPVLVELAVLVVEVGVRGVQVAVRIAPATAPTFAPCATRITTDRVTLTAEFYARSRSPSTWHRVLYMRGTKGDTLPKSVLFDILINQTVPDFDRPKP